MRTTFDSAAAIRMTIALPAFFLCVAVANAAGAAPVVLDQPAEPAEGRTVVEPTEDWRVGGYSEEEGELFGVVRRAAIDAHGHTYLLDQQLHEIRVFDAEGRFLRGFGRQGEGPGELNSPQDITLLPDGRVVVLHGRPSRLTLFAPDGGVGDDLTIGDGEAFGFAQRMQLAGGQPVLQRSVTTLGEGKSTSTQMLVAVDPVTGKHNRVYLEESSVNEQMGSGGRVMITMTTNFVSSWTAGSDGRVYVVRDPKRYEIEVYGPDGVHERTLRRAYERVRKPDQVLEAERKGRKQFAERFGSGSDEREIDPFYPDIDTIHVRPNGEVWVLPSAGRHDTDRAILGVFDVFDGNGRFVRQVEVRVAFDRKEDEFTFDGAYLIVFENAIDALRGGGGGMVFSFGGSDTDDEDDAEVEPLAIVRYPLP